MKKIDNITIYYIHIKLLYNNFIYYKSNVRWNIIN